MEQTANESGAVEAAPDAAEAPPQPEERGTVEGEAQAPAPQRRSILEMLDEPSPATGSPAGESTTDAADADDGPAPEPPRRRSFKDPSSLKGLGRRDREEIDTLDSPATREADASPSSTAGRAGRDAPDVAAPEEAGSPSAAPAASVRDGTGDADRAAVDDEDRDAVDDEGDPDDEAHPVVDESAQAVVDDLVPEWIGPTEPRRERGLLGRLMEGLLGWGRSTVEAGTPEAAASEAGTSEAGTSEAGTSETGADDGLPETPPFDPAGTIDASSPEPLEADRDTARARIRAMVRERDRATVAAREDAARVYELASSIDDFVDAILAAARRD